jgi:hypothetical protein
VTTDKVAPCWYTVLLLLLLIVVLLAFILVLAYPLFALSLTNECLRDGAGLPPAQD